MSKKQKTEVQQVLTTNEGQPLVFQKPKETRFPRVFKALQISDGSYLILKEDGKLVCFTPGAVFQDCLDKGAFEMFSGTDAKAVYIRTCEPEQQRKIFVDCGFDPSLKFAY